MVGRLRTTSTDQLRSREIGREPMRLDAGIAARAEAMVARCGLDSTPLFFCDRRRTEPALRYCLPIRVSQEAQHIYEHERVFAEHLFPSVVEHAPAGRMVSWTDRDLAGRQRRGWLPFVPDPSHRTPRARASRGADGSRKIRSVWHSPTPAMRTSTSPARGASTSICSIMNPRSARGPRRRWCAPSWCSPRVVRANCARECND